MLVSECKPGMIRAGPSESEALPCNLARGTVGRRGRRARRASGRRRRAFENARQELREGHLALRDSAHRGLPERGHVRPSRELGKDLDERAAVRRAHDVPTAPLDKRAVEQRLDDRRLRRGAACPACDFTDENGRTTCCDGPDFPMRGGIYDFAGRCPWMVECGRRSEGACRPNEFGIFLFKSPP
jgi:hypothetical protein